MKRVFLFLILIVLFGSVFAESCATASALGSSGGVYFTGCINKTVYSPGETIIVSGSGYGGQCASGDTILDLNANGVVVLSFYRKGVFTSASRLFGTTYLIAPQASGAYSITFAGTGFNWGVQESPTKFLNVAFVVNYAVNSPPVINSVAIVGSNSLLKNFFLRNHFGTILDPFERVACAISASDSEGDNINYDVNFYYRVPLGGEFLLSSFSGNQSNYDYNIVRALPVGARIYCSAKARDNYGGSVVVKSFTETVWSPVRIYSGS